MALRAVPSGIAFILIIGFLTKSYRLPEQERDPSVRSMVQEIAREHAAAVEHNPRATLERRKREVSAEIVDLQVVRSWQNSMVARIFGDRVSGYEAFLTYKDGSATRCLAMDLRWVERLEAWRPILKPERRRERCEPTW